MVLLPWRFCFISQISTWVHVIHRFHHVTSQPKNMPIPPHRIPVSTYMMESLPSRYLICRGWAPNSQVVIASWISAISNSRSVIKPCTATHPTLPPHPVATSCGSRARWPSGASLICSSKIRFGSFSWQGHCVGSQWSP